MRVVSKPMFGILQEEFVLSLCQFVFFQDKSLKETKHNEQEDSRLDQTLTAKLILEDGAAHIKALTSQSSMFYDEPPSYTWTLLRFASA